MHIAYLAVRAARLYGTLFVTRARERHERR